jgi:hypothetical protein
MKSPRLPDSNDFQNRCDKRCAWGFDGEQKCRNPAHKATREFGDKMSRGRGVIEYDEVCPMRFPLLQISVSPPRPNFVGLIHITWMIEGTRPCGSSINLWNIYPHAITGCCSDSIHSEKKPDQKKQQVSRNPEPTNTEAIALPCCCDCIPKLSRYHMLNSYSIILP